MPVTINSDSSLVESYQTLLRSDWSNETLVSTLALLWAQVALQRSAGLLSLPRMGLNPTAQGWPRSGLPWETSATNLAYPEGITSSFAPRQAYAGARVI